MSRYEDSPPPEMMVLLVLTIFIGTLLVTLMAHPVTPSIPIHRPSAVIEADTNCPKCLDIPKGMKRLRQTTLLTEQVTISLPRPEYLEYLTGRCQERTGHGRNECLWRLNEISNGEADINLLINPIYGRSSPLQEKWIDYIKRKAYRLTTELLEEFERGLGNREKSLNEPLRTS